MRAASLTMWSSTAAAQPGRGFTTASAAGRRRADRGQAGKTPLDDAQLAELLGENGIRPAGFTVVGTRRPKRSEYHYYGRTGGGGEIGGVLRALLPALVLPAAVVRPATMPVAAAGRLRRRPQLT